MKRSAASVAARVMAVLLAMGLGLPAQSALASVLASPWAVGHKAKARLVAGRTAPGAGGALFAFVEVELAPGWKTYWRTPGDTGLPPAFDWSKSVNLAKADVEFPAPKVFTDKSGQTVGYEGHVVFPVRVTAQAADQPVSLAVNLQYGICKDVCVPIEAELELGFSADEVAAAPASALDALGWVPRAQAQRLPEDPALVRAESQLTGDAPKIVVEGAFPGQETSAAVFLEASNGQYLPIPSEVGRSAGGARVFAASLAKDVDLAELKGQTITVTLVGAAGASYATFVVK